MNSVTGIAPNPNCGLPSVTLNEHWQARCGWCDKLGNSPAVIVGNRLVVIGEAGPVYLEEFIETEEIDEDEE